MLTGHYKNLASKGRYGDTMLAHVNPEEAAMLKSMGGAGTINPQTGLREFYGTGQIQFLPQFTLEPLPSLGQALDPASLANLATQLNTTTVPQVNRGLGGSTAAYDKVSDDYSQYVDRSPSLGMGGGRQVQGYTLPSEQTFQGKPLEVKYDDKGNEIEETSLISKDTYKYDDMGNQIEWNSYNSGGGLNFKATSKYEFDEKGNWIKKISFTNQIPNNIDERKYEYYE